MSAQNKAAVRRWLDQAINRGNLSVLDEMVAASYVYHGPGQELHGLEALKALITGFREAFPDLHCSIDDMVAERNRVATRYTITGTQQGEIMGVKPTGKEVTIPLIVITRFVRGKVVEDWEVFDVAGMLRQLGVSRTAP